MKISKEEKARNLRYKKAMLAGLNFEEIQNTLYDISGVCSEYQYYFEKDDDTLLNALDGDEEQEYEFKMMFSDLSYECDQLYDVMNNAYVTEHFDDFFVGIMRNGGSGFKALGFDSYQEDYYGLTSYESELASNESAKRLKRLTKDELISVCGQCFGLAISFFNIQYKYDYLKAAFDILKDENTSFLQIIKDIEIAYDKADEDGWCEYKDSVRAFDKLLRSFDECGRIWVE